MKEYLLLSMVKYAQYADYNYMKAFTWNKSMQHIEAILQQQVFFSSYAQ